jgi:hypothetical protein
MLPRAVIFASSTWTLRPVAFFKYDSSCSKEIFGISIPWLFTTIKVPMSLVFATDVNKGSTFKWDDNVLAFVSAKPFGMKTKLSFALV